MKNFFIGSIVIIIIVGIGVVIYVVTQNNESDTNINSNTNSLGLANTVVQTNVAPDPDISTGKKYSGNGFTIDIPEGWLVAYPIAETLATITKADETHPDGSKAQEINYKSYITISSGDTQGKTLVEISENVQQEILTDFPSATVSVSSPGSTLQGVPVENSIIRMTEDEAKYAIFLMVALKDSKYFAVLANTTNGKWDEYRNIFLNTTASLEFD